MPYQDSTCWFSALNQVLGNCTRDKFQVLGQRIRPGLLDLTVRDTRQECKVLPAAGTEVPLDLTELSDCEWWSRTFRGLSWAGKSPDVRAHLNEGWTLLGSSALLVAFPDMSTLVLTLPVIMFIKRWNESLQDRIPAKSLGDARWNLKFAEEKS